MKAGPLLLVVSIAGGTYLFTPRPDDATAPAAETGYMSSDSPWSKDHVAVPDRRRERTGSRRGGGEVTLARSEDGHFYAAVSIDSRDTEMLVDTGASVIALTGDDARALGVDWRADDVMPVARGAGGAVYGVPVKLDRVALGGIEVHDVEAVVVPEGLPVSLLGQSFLGRVGRVAIEDDTMVLGG